MQNSRIVLRSPISSAVGSPPYFLSCGIAPIEQNWKMRLSRPIVVRPSITQCAPIDVPSAIVTCAPMIEYGPTLTEAARSARGSTIAVGWIKVIADAGVSCTGRCSPSLLQSRSRTVHINSASTASAPSTVARVLYLKMPDLERSTSASITS